MSVNSLQDKKKYGERLRQVRNEIGATLGDFSKKLGIYSGMIRKVENNRSKPGYDLLMKLNEVYNIDPNYILLGQENMFLNKTQTEKTEGFDIQEQGEDVVELFRKMEKSPLLRFAVLSFALTYQVEKKNMIQLDMEKENRRERSLKGEV